MLRYNGRAVFVSVNKFRGSGYESQAGNNYIKAPMNRNAGGFSQTFSAYPNGNLAPSSFLLPQKSGSISSYTDSEGEISGNVSLIPARNLEASSSSTITVTNAQLDQIVSAVANGTATLSTVNAILAGAASLQANGTLVLTSSAAAGAKFSVTANANGTITGSITISALAFMEAEAGGPTPLSPEGLANAVWSAPSAENNEPGTMGEKVNDASAAGNPWSAEITTNNTVGTFGYVVNQIYKIVKLIKNLLS